jgi:hypothetical protein
MKGRNYAEIQEMFEKGVPARQFKHYKCQVDEAIAHKKYELEEMRVEQA